MVDTEMTSTPTQKPETIRLADALKRRTPFLDGSSTIDHAEKELLRQHAEIARLTAENEALKAAVSEAVAAERIVCAELIEQQHTWITNVAASALIRARGTPCL